MPVETRGNSHRVRARHRGLPKFQTTVYDRVLADHIDDTLKEIVRSGRADIFRALADGSLDPEGVWNAVKSEARDANGVLVLIPRITAAHTVEWLKAQQGVTAVDEESVDKPVVIQSFEELFEEYKEEARSGRHLNQRKKTFAPTTIDRYDDSIQALFHWDDRLRSSDPRQLSKNDLTDFRTARADAGASVGTLNRDQDAIQSFLTWIEERHPGLAPPSRPRIKKMIEDNKRDRAMTPEHFALWCATISRHAALADKREFIPIFAAAASCGLRIDEAQGLRRCDVIVEKGVPVRFKIQEYPGHRLKSPGAAREVGIVEDLVPTVQALLARRGASTDLLWDEGLRAYHSAQYAFEKACLVAGLDDKGAAYLMDEERRLDKLLAAGEITVKGKAAMLDRAKQHIPKNKLRALYTMHSLRHSCAVQLHEAGLELNEVRLVLGQACISTTQGYVNKALSKKGAARAAEVSARAIPLTGLLGHDLASAAVASGT